MTYERLCNIKQRFNHLKSICGNAIFFELKDVEELIKEVEGTHSILQLIMNHHYECSKHYDCEFFFETAKKGLQ